MILKCTLANIPLLYHCQDKNKVPLWIICIILRSSEKYLKVYYMLYLFFCFGLITLLLFPQTIEAVCPVCTITATAGVGLCRWLGIDDLISGVWLGGMTLSAALWLAGWFKKKQWFYCGAGFLTVLSSYILVLLPLYLAKIIGHPQNKLWGIDKLIFGIAGGSVAFALAVLLHELLKRKNNGKSYFPYQKVVLPVVFLIITSVIFYFLSKC